MKKKMLLVLIVGALLLAIPNAGLSQQLPVVAHKIPADFTTLRGDGAKGYCGQAGGNIKRLSEDGNISLINMGGKTLTSKTNFIPSDPATDLSCDPQSLYANTYDQYPGSPFSGKTFQTLSLINTAGFITTVFTPFQKYTFEGLGGPLELTYLGNEEIYHASGQYFTLMITYPGLNYALVEFTLGKPKRLIYQLENTFRHAYFACPTNNHFWWAGLLASGWNLYRDAKSAAPVFGPFNFMMTSDTFATQALTCRGDQVALASQEGTNGLPTIRRFNENGDLQSTKELGVFKGKKITKILDITMGTNGAILAHVTYEDTSHAVLMVTATDLTEMPLPPAFNLMGINYLVASGTSFGVFSNTSGGFVYHFPSSPSQNVSGQAGKTSRFQCLDCGGRVTVKIGSNTIQATPLGNDQYEFAVPATATSGAIIVEVANDAGSPVQFPLQLTITASPLAVATTTLPAGTAGVNYQTTLTVTGGTGPYSWALAAGSALPVGLTLRADGVLTGVPSIPGVYQISATVKDSVGQTAQAQFTLTIAANEQTPKVSAFVNAASGTQELAPGTYATIIGTNLSVNTMVPSKLPLPTTLAQTSVLVNGSPVILVYVSPGQINILLPDNLPIGQPLSYKIVTVSASGKTLESDTGTVTLQANAPGAFQDTSRQNDPVNGENLYIPIATDGNYQIVGTPNAPALSGSVIALWMTGLGKTDILVPYGALSPSDPPARCTASPIRLTFEGQDAPIAFCGLSPGSVGLYQLNFTVPTIGEGGESKLRKGILEIGSQKFSFSLFW